jgi:DNA-binding LacI/PurR family transcriptional regulator
VKSVSFPPTIRDVAKHAHVSPATVSRVLNGNNGVRGPARMSVEKAIAELGFVPNLNARRLSLGKTFTIGVISPYFIQHSFVERLRGIESVIGKTEYDLIVFNVENVEQRDRYFANVARRERVDGLIIITLTPNTQHVEQFIRSKVPIVLVDAQHAKFTSICEDSIMGGWLATQHLISLGHRKIGFISDKFIDPFTGKSRGKLRYEGYEKAMQSAGLMIPSNYVMTGLSSRADARSMARTILTLPDRPTAIFAFSDIQAIGVMEAARELNLRVPHDLSVVGYDDIEMAEVMKLTTIHQSLFESGVLGAQKLLEQIEVKQFSNQPNMNTGSLQQVNIELRVRESTIAPSI